MLNNKECKQILESDGNEYSEKEVKAITEVVKVIAEITIRNLKLGGDEESDNNGARVQ